MRIEFQKRGMPHAHVLLWTDSDLTDPSKVESFLSAEFPTLEHAHQDFEFLFGTKFETCEVTHRAFANWYLPHIQERVKSFMTHKHSKRCGGTDKKCQWNYPFLTANRESYFTPLNYVVHKRRTPVNDQWIVPHNRILLSKFNCHINLEPCAMSSCIGYILEYVAKKESPAKLHFAEEQKSNQPRDRIQEFIASTYVGTCEAAWQLHQFHLFRAKPAVTKIPLHDFRERFRIAFANMPTPSFFTLSEQELYFCRPTAPELCDLTLLHFYDLYRPVRFDPINAKLIHTDLSKIELLRPNLALTDKSILPKLMKSFQRLRDRRVCRLAIVLPKEKEKFMMRKLFLHKPASSYCDLKTDSNGFTHDSFEASANAEGLLANNDEWEHHLKDAILLQSSPQKLRHLYVILVSWALMPVPFTTNFYLNFLVISPLNTKILLVVNIFLSK